VDAPDSVTVGGDRVQQPAWILFVPLLILVGIIALIVSAVRRRNRMMYPYPFPPPPPPRM